MARREIMTPLVGKWVEAYSPGIWQVTQCLSGFNELRDSLDKPKRVSRQTLVFAKRLVDENWRKSFRIEMCDAGLIHPLSESDRTKLSEYLDSHPEVASEFESYQPDLPDFGTGVGFNLPHLPDFEDRRALVDATFEGIEEGLTKDEILQRVAGSPLAPYMVAAPTNLSVTFGNVGHELRDGDFIFRSYIAQPF